jgi:hypothetical protein
MHRLVTKDPRTRFRPQHQASRACDVGVRELELVFGYARSERGPPRLPENRVCHRFSREPPALAGLHAAGGRGH